MEWIFILALVGVGAWIIKERLEERRIEEAEEKAIALLEHLMGDEDNWDEDLWYDVSDEQACELCEDIITEDEIFVGLGDENGYLMVFCEFCLNPDLAE